MSHSLSFFPSGDVSSLFPFHIGYALDYVCHCGSLPNDGVTDSSMFPSMARWLVSSFLIILL